MRQHLCEVVEVLGPPPLHKGPEDLDGIEGARVRRQEELLEVLVIHVMQKFGVVDAKIIKDHPHATAHTLGLESLKEAL